MVLFHFLLFYLKIFYQQGEIIKLNKSLKERRDAYLLQCDDFYQWFRDTFARVEEIAKDDKGEEKAMYMTIKEVFYHYKCGNYYQNLPKPQKRKITKDSFTDELLKRPDIVKIHRDRYRRVVNGKKIDKQNVLIGIIKKPECLI